MPTYASGGCKTAGTLEKLSCSGAAAACRSLCKPPPPPWAGQGTRQGWHRGLLSAWGSLPMAPSLGGPEGFGSIPVAQEGMSGVGPRPSPVPCGARAVPMGWWLYKCPTCGHSAQCWHAHELGTWDEEECRKNPNCREKIPNPQKIQTIPESLEHQGRKKLDFLGKGKNLNIVRLVMLP